MSKVRTRSHGKPRDKNRAVNTRGAELKKLHNLYWCAHRDLEMLLAKQKLEELSKEEVDQIAEARRYIAQYQDYMRTIRLRPFRDARPKKLQRKLAYETPEPYEGTETQRMECDEQNNMHK